MHMKSNYTAALLPMFTLKNLTGLEPGCSVPLADAMATAPRRQGIGSSFLEKILGI
jgi:hypothetical protein